MSLNEMMRKSNPARIEREMKNSEYLKLVDRNTELVDRNTELVDRNTELVDELKDYKLRVDRAIEILDIYGTSNYETADLLYSALRGSDKNG